MYEKNLLKSSGVESQKKTGLEMTKKAFQPKIEQISFPKAVTVLDTDLSEKRISLPNMASMASKSGINIQMSTNGINDRVKNMLGNGLKLTDLKSRQQLTGIENLKKKI